MRNQGSWGIQSNATIPMLLIVALKALKCFTPLHQHQERSGPLISIIAQLIETLVQHRLVRDYESLHFSVAKKNFLVQNVDHMEVQSVRLTN